MRFTVSMPVIRAASCVERTAVGVYGECALQAKCSSGGTVVRSFQQLVIYSMPILTPLLTPPHVLHALQSSR